MEKSDEYYKMKYFKYKAKYELLKQQQGGNGGATTRAFVNAGSQVISKALFGSTDSQEQIQKKLKLLQINIDAKTTIPGLITILEKKKLTLDKVTDKDQLFNIEYIIKNIKHNCGNYTDSLIKKDCIPK